MRAFHFLNKKYAIENISKSRLKTARINQLNDPFEYYVKFISNGELLEDKYINKVKDRLHKSAGFLCFSRRLGNPVQWAHYAENHEGLCLEFEIPSELPIKIQYRKAPISIHVDKPGWDHKFSNIAARTKYKHWSYEREIRVHIQLSSPDVIHDNGNLFMPMSDTLKLTKVYKGINCTLNNTDYEALLNKGIQIINTKKSLSLYEITNF